MLICVLFAISFSTVFCTDYAIVVDAGSTSSKLKLYYWDDMKDIHQIETKFFNMEKLTSYLTQSDKNLTRDMVSFVNQILPHVPNQQDIPFYLGATAGLRLLKVEESESLIERVRKVIKDNYRFKCDDRQIRVLSGEEEGIFGWLMVQYLRKDFDFSSTAGALDMGGASTQISFIPQKQQILADKKTIKVFGTIVDTYSHSFLRYGMNEAMDQLNRNLVVYNSKNEQNDDIEHPCLFKGDRREIDGQSYIGTSDVFQCRKEVMKILRMGQYCVYPDGTCSVDSDYVPKVPVSKDQTFYAFSGFEYLPGGLHLPSTGLKLKLLNTTAWSFCEGHNFTWAKEHTGMLPGHVWDQCFNVIYALELLLKGYGFDEEVEGQVVFSGKVSGMDVGWALGSLVYELMFQDTVVTKDVTKDVKVKDYMYAPMIIGFSFLAVALCMIVMLVLVIVCQSVLLVASVCFLGLKKSGSKSRIYERVDGD